MTEIWKDIEGYEGFYQVSNLGRVRSWKARGGFNNLKGVRATEPKVLTNVLTYNGYLGVTLSMNSKKTNIHVHRLVALAFLAEDENRPWVNHIDGDKTNNHVDNLEWVTPTENLHHAIETGLQTVRGSGNSFAKLNESKVVEIKTRLATGTETHRQIAEDYGVKEVTISAIASNRNWSHVTIGA